MLSYFKYIAAVSFAIVLIVAVLAGGYFKRMVVKATLQQPSEAHTTQVAEYFEENIWCRYAPVFKKLGAENVKDWKDNPLFQKFERASHTILDGFPAQKLTLYTTDGTVLFSTNSLETVFFDVEGSNTAGLAEAAAGSPNSRLVPSMGMRSAGQEQSEKGSYIQAFAPISTASCSQKPEGMEAGAPQTVVMEALYPSSHPIKQISFFQSIISAGIVTVFILLYLALLITSRKAEKIIGKQHEEKVSLEKAKTVAEAQSQQKSMFLANVSHELRTPLNAIIGFSEIIKDEAMGPIGHPQYKEYIGDINASGVHLLSLINDILDYSKAEAKKLDVEAVDVDLTKIAVSCLRLVEPRAKQAKVELLTKVPERHVVLNADPKRMKQIILNLLSNAVKFTPEGGHVTLSIEADMLAGHVTLVVADTGIGIEAKDISKAMAPFGQIDSSLSRKYEGTGLGLPLTKKLTELMNGQFDIASEVGLGTTITLVFPLVKHAKPTDPDSF